MTDRNGRDRERGSVAVEFALTVPVVVFALVLLSLAWRTTTAASDVRRAAGEAARAGTLQRTPAAAVTAARATAAATPAARHANCQPLTVNVDTGDFPRGGTLAVTVT